MIYINDIPSFRDPESFSLKFDDRIEKVELINGATAQNYGHIEDGDVFSLTCVFTATNYERVKLLWETGTRVNFTDEAGVLWQNLRLIFRNIQYLAKFPDYKILNFELWRA